VTEDVCPRCGKSMPSTHSRRRGGLIDRRRECLCGHVDRVLVQPEKIIKILPVVRKHTVGPRKLPASRVYI